MLKALLGLLLLPALSITVKTKPPNIVFVLTDDQDVAIFGYHPMPKAQKLIGDAGMTFTNMFVSSPLCCPSRSSILTGKYVHNHKAKNNSLSGNCSSRQWQQGEEKTAFPVHLQKNGYKMFFGGKYLNQYGRKGAGGVKHIPPGWDDWNALVGNSVYYNYSLSANGVEEKHKDNYTEDYLTDVIKRKALTFLDKQSSASPFFMMLSTPACHAPFDPAPQYAKNFSDKEAPRTKSFNVHGKDKHWLVEQAITPMPNDTIQVVDNIYRNRWRTLLSVDDMIEAVVQKLEAMKVLDNTYIVFTSDNGYHLGQFSLPSDKRQLYDFDLRVPLMVRGPGIKANSTSEDNIITVDLAPTFLDIAGVKAPPTLDGATFKTILMGQSHPFRPTVLVEHSGEGLNYIPGCPKYKNQGLYACDAHCVCEDSWNNTYGCVRSEIEKSTYKYCSLQDHVNFLEVYDLKQDPYELTNIAKTGPAEILSKLGAQLSQLSTCSGKSCHSPGFFHPDD